MSQILTATSPLWKDGRNGNVQFLASWKRLQKEDPVTYALIEQKEGFTCESAEFEYRVGSNKYGLYLMRKRLTGLEKIPNIEEEDKPTQRPPMTDVTPLGPQSLSFDVNVILLAIGKLSDSINLLTLSHLCSTPEEREEIRKKVMQQ